MKTTWQDCCISVLRSYLAPGEGSYGYVHIHRDITPGCFTLAVECLDGELLKPQVILCPTSDDTATPRKARKLAVITSSQLLEILP